MKAKKRRKMIDKVATLICVGNPGHEVHVRSWPISQAGQLLPFCGQCYTTAEKVVDQCCIPLLARAKL